MKELFIIDPYRRNRQKEFYSWLTKC